MAKITWRSWLERRGLASLRFNATLLDSELKFRQPDRDAAWDLYVELITRITTQPLPESAGTEKAALDSVHALFPLTRETIKRHGRHCQEFTRLAVVILNQKIRPFTAKWHRELEMGALNDPAGCIEFRGDLASLQDVLRSYTKLLADLAEVEDLTDVDPGALSD